MAVPPKINNRGKFFPYKEILKEMRSNFNILDSPPDFSHKATQRGTKKRRQ
jgi:hypothetical protein